MHSGDKTEESQILYNIDSARFDLHLILNQLPYRRQKDFCSFSIAHMFLTCT
jgi:hypothetical protein